MECIYLYLVGCPYTFAFALHCILYTHLFSVHYHYDTHISNSFF
jgi:hypothetical protein